MTSIIAGILLILGAISFYNGKIYIGSIYYIVADIFWIMNAIRLNDWYGLILIIIGTMLGIGVFLKMHHGILNKTITK